MKYITITESVTLKKVGDEVKISITLPVPPSSPHEEEKMGMSLEEVTQKIFKPLCMNLANYVAAIISMPDVGFMFGLPLLEEKIREAAREVLPIVRAAGEMENRVEPPRFSLN